MQNPSEQVLKASSTFIKNDDYSDRNYPMKWTVFGQGQQQQIQQLAEKHKSTDMECQNSDVELIETIVRNRTHTAQSKV